MISTKAQSLKGRTILIAPNTTRPDDLSAQLERLGARVIICPRPEISGPEIYAPVDEVIENLYGYDWLIFAGVPLRGLNILIPRAAISRDRLPNLLEEAGARVDVVAAYRTVTAERQELPRISTLLAGGGVDCVVFPNASGVYDFAQVLDVHDLFDLLSNVAVACADEATSSAAVEFGLKCGIGFDSQSGALGEAIAVNLFR